MLLRLGLLGLFVMGAVGCSSIKSTMLTRSEDNTGWCKVRHLQGVPITLKVPTHLRVYVYQQHFLEQANVGGVSKWQMMKTENPLFDFGTETLYTEKIFTTDFKRPGAGAFNLDVNMSDDQYIQKIQQDITDETLEQVAAIVEKLPGLFSPAPGLPGAKEVAGNEVTSTEGVTLKRIKSVVAAGLFEVNDPNFELNVQEFICNHLNNRPKIVDSVENAASSRSVENGFEQVTMEAQ